MDLQMRDAKVATRDHKAEIEKRLKGNPDLDNYALLTTKNSIWSTQDDSWKKTLQRHKAGVRQEGQRPPASSQEEVARFMATSVIPGWSSPTSVITSQRYATMLSEGGYSQVAQTSQAIQTVARGERSVFTQDMAYPQNPVTNHDIITAYSTNPTEDCGAVWCPSTATRFSEQDVRVGIISRRQESMGLGENFSTPYGGRLLTPFDPRPTENMGRWNDSRMNFGGDGHQTRGPRQGDVRIWGFGYYRSSNPIW
ncbi:hypothetical protein BJ170DRAFT_681717 [Xylariales sp. AK1849]|nr:hypothetical protein BJ170DRAFT_681717 [Xylariales sp. AK1849]